MEIALVSPTSIRIKGKQISFLVDPIATKAKQIADAVLLTTNDRLSSPEVDGARLTMAGPGEYEIGGIKITGVKNGEVTSYFVTLDGLSLLISKASVLKGKENVRDVDVAVIASDGVVDQSALATVISGVAIFYADQAQENVKSLGKETAATAKYVITKDKLPQEMEVVLLA